MKNEKDIDNKLLELSKYLTSVGAAGAYLKGIRIALLWVKGDIKEIKIPNSKKGGK